MTSAIRKKQKTEEEQTAASYIVNFYNEVENVTHHYAIYNNMLLELSNKYPQQETLDKASQEEKQVILDTVQNLRYFIQKTYIKYNAIALKLGKQMDKELEDSYKKIMNTFMITTKESERYIHRINYLLMESVMTQLLETSQNLIQALYSEEV